MLILAILTTLSAADAAAQMRRERIWIAVNAGLQTPAAQLSDRFDFERNVEPATADVVYEKDPRVFFDGSVGFRFYGAVGAAVAFSRSTRDGPADIDASIPHPFFDDRPRAIAGTVDGVTRAETGLHTQVTYTIDWGGPLTVILAGGPSLLQIDQDLVTAVRYADTYPFDEAAFTTADIRRSNGSAWGFNVGVDVAWMAGRRRQFGAGGMLRYSRASVDLDVPDGRTIGVTAGGVQAGAGVRIRF